LKNSITAEKTFNCDWFEWIFGRRLHSQTIS